jgi:hypothetical protein
MSEKRKRRRGQADPITKREGSHVTCRHHADMGRCTHLTDTSDRDLSCHRAIDQAFQLAGVSAAGIHCPHSHCHSAMSTSRRAAGKASSATSYQWAMVDRLIIASYVMFIFIALTVDCINAFGQRCAQHQRRPLHLSVLAVVSGSLAV